MASIRKTKKRLKREIADLRAAYYSIEYSIAVCFLGKAIYDAEQLRLQQLQQLKRKKR